MGEIGNASHCFREGRTVGEDAGRGEFAFVHEGEDRFVHASAESEIVGMQNNFQEVQFRLV